MPHLWAIVQPASALKPHTMEHAVFPHESALQRADNYVDFVSNFITEGVDLDGDVQLLSPTGECYDYSLREFNQDILTIEMLFEQFNSLMVTKGAGRKARKAVIAELFQFIDACHDVGFTDFVDSLPFKGSLKGLYFAEALLQCGPDDYSEIKDFYHHTTKVFG